MKPLTAPTLDEIERARGRIADLAVRTPLLRLQSDDGPAEIYLKPENLQPIGSFKLRGAGNAMRQAPEAALARGVVTASAGNMAQGVAYVARELGIECRVIVPDHAPETKLAATRRLGGKPLKVPFDAWWDVIVTHELAGLGLGPEIANGHFIHPVCDSHVIAGNGTIGIEIAEDLPDVDAVIVPYGGGGLSCGIAAALAELAPGARIFASEVETAAPLFASLSAGEPKEVSYTPSFVDGIGGKSVLPEMWPMASSLLAGSLVVSLEETAAAIRLLVERHRLVAEGAGASSVAAALSGQAGNGKIVCVISGGNIDSNKLSRILAGEVP